MVEIGNLTGAKLETANKSKTTKPRKTRKRFLHVKENDKWKGQGRNDDNSHNSNKQKMNK